MDSKLIEYSIYEDENKIAMITLEYDIFKSIMGNNNEIIIEGVDFSKIKEKIISLIQGAIKIIKDIFKKIKDKIKEITRRPILEASISDSIYKKYQDALKTIDEGEERYIGRIINSKNLQDEVLSMFVLTNDKCGEELEKVYQRFINSTAKTNPHEIYTLRIEDYYSDEIIAMINDILDGFKNKTVNNKYITVVTTKNIKKYSDVIHDNIHDCKLIYKVIKNMEDNSDKYLSDMKRIATSLRADKKETVNNELFAAFAQSCYVYEQVVAKSSQYATKCYFGARSQYIRCMIKAISMAGLS